MEILSGLFSVEWNIFALCKHRWFFHEQIPRWNFAPPLRWAPQYPLPASFWGEHPLLDEIPVPIALLEEWFVLPSGRGAWSWSQESCCGGEVLLTKVCYHPQLQVIFSPQRSALSQTRLTTWQNLHTSWAVLPHPWWTFLRPRRPYPYHWRYLGRHYPYRRQWSWLPRRTLLPIAPLSVTAVGRRHGRVLYDYRWVWEVFGLSRFPSKIWEL